MAGKHAKPKQGSKFRRNIAVTGTIAVGGMAIPATFAGAAHAEDSPSPAATSAPTGATNTGATPPADYIVQRGDNLSEIAARFGVSLDALEQINPGIIAGDRPDDYSLIFAGGHVHLPVGATEGKHARKSHVHAWGHSHGRHGHTWYANCDEAPAGLHKGQAGYRHALDMDGDGKACEGPWPPAQGSSSGSDTGSSDSGSGTTTPPSDSGSGGTTTPPTTNPDGTVIPVLAPDAPGTPSGYAAHSVSYWAPLIEQAKSLVGVDYSTAAIEGLMSAESGGDPNAINNYDSNAQNGTPSKGLMQVIQPTFDANHVAGTSQNLYDPLANIAAALQYIKVTYGYVPSSPY